MSNREQVINDLQMQIEELEERLTIALEGQPEIVRCKYCKHLSYPANGVPFCKHIKNFVDADWFCADGERK